ncbi:arabinose transporter [Roseomonas sp. 18066]|uniref:arabinose transporter n=1 Tax=Roseomonas sp. 18066 TaxID=2681412 RepID=UPI001356DCC1|nr:arabinose transporter [Roseomonas sp. 18066]
MTTPPQPIPPARDLRQVVWLTVALFLSYLCVAISLPVTSVHVTTGLGFGNALAGIAVGIAFASTILTRGLAGRLSDQHGGKHAMLRGLLIYAAAGLVCAASALPGLAPAAAYAVLIAGRLLLGWGESLATVGLVAWALGIAGPPRAGRVFSLVGMGLYGAFAVGSPLGVALMDASGFAGAMLACALVPLIGLALVLPVAAVAPPGGERPSFWRILGRIWQPGLVVGLQGVGFAAIGAFMTLLFLSRGWAHAGLGLTCFGLAFVLVRVVFGHLPDRLGSIPVALVSIAVEATGQALLWLAPGPELALAGAALTGLGCSLIFPSMGIEAMRRVAPNLRGTAAGGFSAYQDLAYGLTGPVTGLLADRLGYSAVFLVGGLAAALGFLMLLRMAATRRPA